MPERVQLPHAFGNETWIVQVDPGVFALRSCSTDGHERKCRLGGHARAKIKQARFHQQDSVDPALADEAVERFLAINTAGRQQDVVVTIRGGFGHRTNELELLGAEVVVQGGITKPSVRVWPWARARAIALG